VITTRPTAPLLEPDGVRANQPHPPPPGAVPSVPI